MQMDVLGVCAAYPAQHDACSGYMISEGDTRLLLDCGSGVMGNLPKVSSYFQLSAIIISHTHVDHYLDLFPLRYALTYSLYRPENFSRVPLIMPPGDYDRLFAQDDGKDREKYDQIFSPMEMSEKTEFSFGMMTLGFARMTHPIPSFACRIANQEGFSMVYSSDTSHNDALIQFSQGADLLLCEATLQEQHSGRSFSGHLTAAQAGDIAQRARVKKLVLTHIWPEYDRKISAEEAASTYDGPIEVATTGSSYTIGLR